MLSMEKIKVVWSDIIPQRGKSIGRRIDPPGHPVKFWIGYDEECFMQLMMPADKILDLPQSSQHVLVKANSRKDGKFAICFSLLNYSLKETFISLCFDIVNSTYSASSNQAGIEAAVNRFSMWLVLMSKGRSEKMSDAVVRGMIGELAVLRDICIPRYGISHAVNGWIGPLHADRDFEYEDNWFEVKSLSLSGDSVFISSFDQLDIDRLGMLTICRLEKTANTDTEAICLNSLVEEIEEIISEDPNAIATFHVRLILSGYEASEERASEFFHIHGYEKYWVDDEFPRIRNSLLPTAIKNGKYKLDIAALAPWQN